MRKFTRIFLMSVVTVIMFGLFTGSDCDNGSSSKKKDSLVGTWQFTKMVMYDTPYGDFEMTPALLGFTSMVMQINEDGTVTSTTTYADGSQDVETGTWSVDGNEITVEGADIDDTVTYDIDGNTMTITLIMPIDIDDDGVEEDYIVDMIWTRVS